MAIMQNPEDFICHELGKIFVVKANSIGLTTQYLGNKVSYVTLENGRGAWSFSSSQYAQDVVNTSEDYTTIYARWETQLTCQLT